MTPEELKAQREALLSRQRETELELARLKELERQMEAEKPLEVVIIALEADRIYFKMSRFDQRLLDTFRTIPSRAYHGDARNSIEYTKLDALRLALEGVVPLRYESAELEAEIKLLTERPEVTVKLDGRGNRLLCTPAPGVSSSPFLSIPGHKFDHTDKYWSVPVWEGWRLYEVLKQYKKVEWAEDAIKIVTGDMERRASLDQLAQQKDCELDLDLNGNRLRPFQKVGTTFIVKGGYRGIIGDKPGLGKTPEFIACVKLLEKELGRPVHAAVICPANAKPNWKRQIAKFTGDQATTFRGLEPRPQDLVKLITPSMKPRWSIFNYDIVGRRTVQQVDRVDEAGRHIKGEVNKYLWADVINVAKFDVIAVDEAHYIKNVDAHRSQAVRQLKCPRVVFLTGTPITNRPRELWPMLTMINEDLFPSHEVFLGTYEDGRGNARNSRELVELLKPLMIRRTHKDVMADLPPVERIYNFYPLSEKAQRIYNKVLDGLYEDWINAEGQELSVNNILVEIMRLKQICAVDKVESVAELATDLYDQASDEEDPKVLIFSQFLPVVRGIARRLGQETLVVTGDTPQDQRPGLVDQFQNDPNIHFMVASKGVLSESLDLTKAGYVVFADYFWTPGAHEQCEGRAYGRMDNPHAITSYYCTSELEEESEVECVEQMIQKILAKKMAVIETIVDGVEAARNASMANELIERMKQELFSRKAK